MRANRNGDCVCVCGACEVVVQQQILEQTLVEVTVSVCALPRFRPRETGGGTRDARLSLHHQRGDDYYKRNRRWRTDNNNNNIYRGMNRGVQNAFYSQPQRMLLLAMHPQFHFFVAYIFYIFLIL